MLRERIKTELVSAMKAKDDLKTSVIRLINSSIKDKDIAARPSGKMDGISDADILQLLQSMIKQRKESIELYQKGNRSDLVKKEQNEIEIISSFLPAQMDETEIETKIKSIIQETNATSMKDMGKIMGLLREKYAGRMDFGKASVIIKGLLS